jgi:hypothetical protein
MGTALTPSEKMRRYRNKMRVAGLRPMQAWVPDVKAPGFMEEARAQSLRVSVHASERNALDFIESVADLDGWQ